MGKSHSTDRNGPIADAPPAASADLLITPYTRPRDVLVWNRDAKSWLRIDISQELDPSVDWLRDAIERQLGRLDDRVTCLFVGRSGQALSSADLKRAVRYFTISQQACTQRDKSRDVSLMAVAV